MSATHRAVTIAVGAVTALSVVTMPATGATDSAPPTLTADFHPAFAVGQPLSVAASTLPDALDWAVAPVIVRWRQSDSSGVCSHRVFQVDASGSSSVVERRTNPASRQQRPAIVAFYDGSQGGDSLRTSGWRIASKDCAGNVASWFVSASGTIVDDSGAAASSDTEGGLDVGAITYSAGWDAIAAADTSNGYALGTAHTATTDGAQAEITLTVDRGGHLALVARRSPSSGSLAIAVDGGPSVVVDLSAADDLGSIIVADRRLTAGTHTVTFTKVGSGGDVAIDAVAVTSGSLVPSAPTPGPLG